MTREACAEYGRKLAQQTPPLPAHVIEEAAGVYVAWLADEQGALDAPAAA